MSAWKKGGSRRWFSWGSLLLLVLGGLIFAGARYAVEQTNTLEFCVSCHEMRENNYAEYKDTIHAKNRTGVKAICSDCHVPHDLVGTTVRKIKAANDVFHHLAGTIDTPEKFEARRLELAKRVWLRMKETDSRECRHCHDAQAMDTQLQGRTAQKQHQKMFSGERTCIDCHYGIAHKEPEGGVEPRDALADQ